MITFQSLSRSSIFLLFWILEKSIVVASIMSSIHKFILSFIGFLILLSSNSQISSNLKSKLICSFHENSLILFETSKFIKDKIHKIKFELYQKSITLKIFSRTESYFLSIIIFTKKLANKKSYFLAFFSSFWVLAIQAEAFLIDSLNFSETSFTCSGELQGDSELSIS